MCMFLVFSVMQQLLEVLHWALPKMSLIASDFSYLPDVKIVGDRAPLVSTKVILLMVDCMVDCMLLIIWSLTVKQTS